MKETGFEPQTHMIKPPALNRGDRVAIVSLSSGMLGEDCHPLVVIIIHDLSCVLEVYGSS